MSIMFSTKITRKAKESLDGSLLPHSCKKSTAGLPTTADIMKKMTEEHKKTSEHALQNPAAESGPLKQSGFDDRLSSMLPSSYTEPQSAIDDVRRSKILNSRPPVYFCKLRTDDKHGHVDLCLHALLFRNSYRANLFFSKQSVLFLRGMSGSTALQLQ